MFSQTMLIVFMQINADKFFVKKFSNASINKDGYIQYGDFT